MAFIEQKCLAGLFSRILPIIQITFNMSAIIDSLFEIEMKYARQPDIIIAFLVRLYCSCIILFITLRCSV